MAFHVYIEPELEMKLDAFCKKTGKKRNTLVREALREFLDKRVSQDWPESVLKFKPDISLPPFEACRDELPAQRDDILAE